MNKYISQFLPILEEKDENLYLDILRGLKVNPLIDKIKSQTKVSKIHVTPFIAPWVLHSLDTPKGKWKLRQPMFSESHSEDDITNHVLTVLAKLHHPYYKRMCIVDPSRGWVTKFYSIEERKNYAHVFQGDAWGHNIQAVNKHTKCVPKLLHWFPRWKNDVNVAIFEYIEGKTLKDLYTEPGKQYDTGHPDVIAGRIPPYWGSIDSVGYKDLFKIKSIAEQLFIDIYKASQNVDLSSATYQQLDNEPEWKEKWKTPCHTRMWNPDDWNLENIIETPGGDYKMIKLDRSVVTDPINAVERFIADFRNQTNLRWESSKEIIKRLA